MGLDGCQPGRPMHRKPCGYYSIAPYAPQAFAHVRSEESKNLALRRLEDDFVFELCIGIGAILRWIYVHVCELPCACSLEYQYVSGAFAIERRFRRACGTPELRSRCPQTEPWWSSLRQTLNPPLLYVKAHQEAMRRTLVQIMAMQPSADPHKPRSVEPQAQYRQEHSRDVRDGLVAVQQ